MLISEIAHQLAIVPLVWLALQRQPRHLGYWWIALAISVSWIADWAAHTDPWKYGWAISFAYPISQTVFVCAVFLHRRHVAWILALMTVAASLVVLLFGIHGPDLIVSTLSALIIARVVWPLQQLGLIRIAVLVYFCASVIALWPRVVWLNEATWYPYQVVRAVGILLFCVAVSKPTIKLHHNARIQRQV